MKHLKNFNNFQLVMEKSNDTYSYGCVMVYFDFPKMEEIHNMISPDDLYTEEEDRTYGLEDEPHVTLLYGLHSDEIKDKDVMECCLSKKIGTVKLVNPSLFKNEKYDVLKFDAENKNLYSLNKKLTEEFPYTTDYPDYHPHSTIAYLKSGKGQKYVDLLAGKDFSVTPNKIVYSKPDGTKIENPIEG